MLAPVLQPSVEALGRVVDVLRAGGLVAMPTETVYGLGCDASQGEAVARLYAAKGRPSFNPLIAHVADVEMAAREGRWGDAAAKLADAFWPGPLTLVLPVADRADGTAGAGSVSDLARAGLSTIALRQPDHPVALELISAFGGPLVAPSANPSGRISPTSAAHVAADIGEKLDLILDGGPCRVGLESTIVSLVGERPVLLRPGGLDPARIESVLGGQLLKGGDSADAPSSPGQLLRHYAPRAALRLDAQDVREGEVLLAFGPSDAKVNLSSVGSLTEAASNLFTMLRELDQTADSIAVAPIPDEGLGLAINDRLRRAAR